MKTKLSLNRISVAAISISAVIMLALPLVVGAQPQAVPTGGNVIPTFYGLYINNGTNTGLAINELGQLSNPTDSINGGRVTIEDSDGLRIKQSGLLFPSISPPRSLIISPYGELTALGGGTILTPLETPVVVRDSDGFRVADNAGNVHFSVDGATGTLSNPGTSNDGNVYVGDGFEVNSTNDASPDAEWFAQGGDPVNNWTKIVSKDGLFSLDRIGHSFSPTRKFLADKLLMNNDGSFWRFSTKGISPWDDLGSYPTISLLKHGVGIDDPIKLAATGGTAIGYLVYQPGPDEFVPVLLSNEKDNLTITDNNSKLQIHRPKQIMGINIPDSANHMAIDNTAAATCVHPVTGDANHPCPVTINSKSGLGGLLTGTIYAAGQFIGTPLLRAGGITIYTQNGGLTIDSTGNGGLTVDTVTGGLTINSDSSGGIELNTHTGGISNKRPGYSPVRVNDSDGLYVAGPVTSTGKIKSYGGIGTFTKRTATVDIAPGTENTAYPACNSGEKLISCGYKTSDYFVVPAVNMMNTTTNRCEIAARNGTASTQTLTGEAMCFNPGV